MHICSVSPSTRGKKCNRGIPLKLEGEGVLGGVNGPGKVFGVFRVSGIGGVGALGDLGEYKWTWVSEGPSGQYMD